jgi:hypothetical protein
MTLAMVRVALENNLSIIKEGLIFNNEKMLSLAKEFNIPIFVANVEAPEEILKARFAIRVEAKKNGAKISNVDPTRFKELHRMYFDTKVKSGIRYIFRGLK